MDRLKPHLFWIVIGAAVVALIIVRAGPVAGMYGAARGQRAEYEALVKRVEDLARRGENLPRPALVRLAEERGETAARLAAQAGRPLIDIESETWPHLVLAPYVDFTIPQDRQVPLELAELRDARERQERWIVELFKFEGSDSTRPLNLIAIPDHLKVYAPAAGAQLLDLPEILRRQRLLWLRYGLQQVLTDPEAGVKAVHRMSYDLVDPLYVGMPDQLAPDTPYVTLAWQLDLSVEFTRIPVLLRQLEMSPRHLKVTSLSLNAPDDAVSDIRSWNVAQIMATETPPTRIEREIFKEGRRVELKLEGVSYDFVLLPETRLVGFTQVKDYGGLAGRLAKAGAGPPEASVYRRIWDLLSEDGRQAVRAVAGGTRPERTLQVRLVDALNEVLANPGFYFDQPASFQTLVLPPAGALLRQALEARRQKGEALDPRDLQRLHRLYLEAGFPAEVEPVYRGWPT